MLPMLFVVVALLSPAAMSSSTPSLISMPTEELERTSVPLAQGSLTADYHAESCPNVQQIVRTAVEEAFREDVAIAAGLLRIFMSDCFVYVRYIHSDRFFLNFSDEH